MPEMTKVLCQAHRETFTTKLDTISRDVEETRKGVGNLNRRLFKGNGSDALDIVIKANAEFRIQQQKREADRLKYKWTRNLSWMVAGAGWAIAIIIFLLDS